MRKIFEEDFEFYDDLPEKFVVAYDIVHFEKEMDMHLVDEKYFRREIRYRILVKNSRKSLKMR